MSYKLYHYLLKHCFTLCGFSVFLFNQTRTKYLHWEKDLLKIVLSLYITIFQSIVTCPKVVLISDIYNDAFYFLISGNSFALYLNSCCFLLLVQKLIERNVKVPCKIELGRF